MSATVIQRWLSAVIVTVSIAAIWLVILPLDRTSAAVQEHVDALHAANINASAMFYSELECQQWLQK